VAKAKSEAELIFGSLEWREGSGDVRVSAMLEIEESDE
jgi:hypothetical protein